jgi:hypothetical protein
VSSNEAVLKSFGSIRRIEPLGTIARALVGAALLAVVFAWGVEWWQVLLGLLGFPAVIALALAAVGRGSEPIRLGGPAGAFGNCAALCALLLISFTADAAALWLGVSMLLGAARGYSGCETLAIPNLLTRRRDHVGCVLFAPVDALEARRTAKRPT